MKDFYMTLLSNSSLLYYPDNKTGSFTVQLPRYMCCEGEWEVAMAEIQYPYSFFTVEDGHNEIKIQTCKITKEYIDAFIETKTTVKKNKSKPVIYKITPGFYHDIKDVISAINEIIQKKVGQPNFFQYDIRSHRVKAKNLKLETDQNMVAECKLSNNLGLLLGYPPGNNIDVDSNHAPHVVNMSKCLYDKMFIYCDIIEQQMFGDKFSKVLRVVNTNQDGEPYYAQNCIATFNTRQYIPLQVKHFEAIRIDIRDIEGNLLPFQHGISSVKLHFKKV